LDEEEDVGPSVYLTPAAVKQAIANGSVSTARLDDMVRRKLAVMIRVGVMDDPAKGGGTIDFAAANRFAQGAAEQSIVLLKNDGNQLPLAASALSRIAVIGGHADAAVLSGGG
ncbi:glycoside hydrolase family 3 C-terminal domain-containing protein, partial [Burkholderia sp. Bp9142]|uniref:glycoside hydrolase family 3 C-terminal domain-containing protein n=1 Tax=Burkholderia sp. Bp9142 TaxID=2184573 RepID=UPI000FAF66E1